MKIKDQKGLDKILDVCSTCGNCLYSCPVYNTEFREPDSPRGKLSLIKAIRNNDIESNKINRKLLDHCLLCGSCEFVCPQKVEFNNIMLSYRNIISTGKRIPLFKKMILLLYNPFIFKKTGWMIDLLAKTPVNKRFLIPKRIKRKGKTGKYSKNKKYDIFLFPGCVMDYFYEGILQKISNFLKKKGFSVIIPPKIFCCGFPHLTQGWEKKFSKLIKKNKKIISDYEFKYMVIPCGTCVNSFKQYYFLDNVKIFELTEFIFKYIPQAKVDTRRFNEKNPLTYHDPCHTLKVLGIGEQPRYFLKKFKKGYIDNDSLTCCGFGGMFSIGFKKTSREILKRKAKELKELGKHTLVTSCPGCLLQFREGLKEDCLFIIDIFT